MTDWLFFSFSDKLKFALKISLAMVIGYITPLALGWSQASVAGITIMLIASAGGASESLSKGLVRIVGTVVGATVGLTLIALFPQERLLYLSALSICLSITIYLYYAHKGDSTVYMLSAVVMMMVYISGPEDAFMYGVDRTMMTIFGIIVYTIIQVFIWPVKKEKVDKPLKEESLFVWFYPDHIKATLQLIALFWSTTLFWIMFNPPGGFLLVTLAVILGLFTTFSPLKPKALMILFTLGFIGATISYVFILPNLVYAWELALFIFAYTFLTFYFLKPKLVVFLLIGMFLLGIENVMVYNFSLFLNTLLVFYIFLIILMFFRNFPFSAKPEHLFLEAKENFIKHAKALGQTTTQENPSFLQKMKQTYHEQHIITTTESLKLWSSQIDYDYFDIKEENIMAFITQCESFKPTLSLDTYTDETINWDVLKVSRF